MRKHTYFQCSFTRQNFYFLQDFYNLFKMEETLKFSKQIKQIKQVLFVSRMRVASTETDMLSNVYSFSPVRLSISRLDRQQAIILTFDNQIPVFYLAIWQRSKDLEHLIPRTRSPGKQGKHVFVMCESYHYFDTAHQILPFCQEPTLAFQVPSSHSFSLFHQDLSC